MRPTSDPEQRRHRSDGALPVFGYRIAVFDPSGGIGGARRREQIIEVSHHVQP